MKKGSSVGLAVGVDEDNVPARVVSIGETRKVSREGRKVKLSPTTARSGSEVAVGRSEEGVSDEGEDVEVEADVEADRSVDAGDEGDEAHGGASKGDKKALKLRARAKKLAAESEERHRKRGVCYLSRVPPHLKPLKLRHMLEQFGVILRVYLAPEGGETITREILRVCHHLRDCCILPLHSSHTPRQWRTGYALVQMPQCACAGSGEEGIAGRISQKGRRE